MSRQKLLLFICSVFIGLLLIGGILRAFLSLINELRFILSEFLPYWLVDPIFFFSTISLIVFVVKFLWPWWNEALYRYKSKTSTKYKRRLVPRNKKQAAKQSLKSIDQLIRRLQNNIESEVIKEERKRMSRELSRGDLIVVVFGTGSSGKTSLIRALLNKIVGSVGAPMGSTLTSKTYRLNLKGLRRGLQLVDTPGILEAGEEGRYREKQAKVIAKRADLMLIVIDSDLRSAEFEVIKTLAAGGKRLLLILNKCDLRGEAEEKKIIDLLKKRSQGLIEPENIIATSASPQSIPRQGKNPLQSNAEIDLLLNRLAKVLHEDGEELIADNILLQCRNLGSAGRRLLNNQRNKKARRCIERYGWISSGVVAANPLPGIDLLGTAAVNAQMVMEIAKIYGIELTRVRAQELALSVGKTLAGLGVVKGGVKVITSALSINLPTLVFSQVIQGIAAAWLTRIAGASFITYFEQDQDWGDGGIQEVVQHHYSLNKRDASLKKFMEIAFQRIVEPLQKNHFLQLPPRPAPPEEVEALDGEHLEP